VPVDPDADADADVLVGVCCWMWTALGTQGFEFGFKLLFPPSFVDTDPLLPPLEVRVYACDADDTVLTLALLDEADELVVAVAVVVPFDC